MYMGELLLGIHCHQPVDNFSWVVDEAIKRCYLPFIKGVMPYKHFKFSIHFSGWLLEYIEKNSKELFSMLKTLAKEDRIEFSSGGFYEPILASIPSKDRIDQIKKLNRYIKKSFGKTPTSMWLTERVWDDSIIEDIKRCGIESVFVDDYHFFTAGFEDSAIDNYFITESGGESINIFPINKELRYAIPFRPVEELDAFFEDFFAKKSVAILYDDGEKFGVWPGTYKWVYEDGWLEKFLRFLEKMRIKCSTFSEYASTHRPKGIAYLPTVSYYEMGEWSLPSKAAFSFEVLKESLKKEGRDENIDMFVKGGIWKNFFVKYYESNKLHKRVLTLSKARAALKNVEFDDLVLKAECNDVFWHGVFGGIYLPNLRDNAYRFVATAENLRYARLDTPMVFMEDINLDGVDEIKAVCEELIFCIDIQKGGSLSEMIDRKTLHNFQNTMTRYKESYHYKALEAISGKEEKRINSSGIDTIHSMDIEKLKSYQDMFVFDSYIKNSLLDHITDYSLDIENFYNGTFRKYSNFIDRSFEYVSIEKDRVVIDTEGKIKGEQSFGAKIEKDLAFLNNGIEFGIKLDSSCDYHLRYICEFNFHFQNQEEVDINGVGAVEKYLFQSQKSIVLRDNLLKKEIVIEFDGEVDFFVYQVNTLSQSESGFDITKQGYSIGAVFNYTKGFELRGSIKLQKANIG